MSFQNNGTPSNDSSSAVQGDWMAPYNHFFSLENDSTTSRNCCISPMMEYGQLDCHNSVPLESVSTSSNASQRTPAENEEICEDDRTPIHHHGSTSTPSILDNGAQEARTANKHVGNYADCPYVTCLFTNPDGGKCQKSINCGDVSDHFRDAHGIRDLGREYRLHCRWQGCERPLTRHNFVRHIRECHLKHSRSPGKGNTSIESSREGELVQLVRPEQLYAGTGQVGEFISRNDLAY